MAQSSSTASTNQSTPQISTSTLESPQIPASLKFLMGNIKNIVAQPLSADNHPLWRSQVLKLFSANGYEGFLNGTTPAPPNLISDNTGQQIPNPQYAIWRLLDQNLAAALYSVISSSILPYVLSETHCADIWLVLDRRLQSITRSRIIQLKHELHYLSMKDKSMSQYLLEVKTKVDALTAAGAPLAVEDVIHYTLDGLSPAYQAFKTSIRTNLQPLTLDDLYTLLCSEELNIAHEASREMQSLQLSGSTVALAATRGRGRGRSNQNRGRPSNQARPPTNNVSNNNTNSNRNARSSKNSVTCQICGKFGHSAIKCWYRHDDQYTTDPPNSALYTSTASSPQQDWFLDSGASSHLTSDSSHFQSTHPYTGTNQVIIGNGQSLPIHSTGKGILPTPQGTIRLSLLHLVPNLSFNLLSVHRLTTDNNCAITFSSNGYTIKDRTTHRTLLTGPCINGLYPVQVRSSPCSNTSNLALISVQPVPDLWHRRLGHPSARILHSLANTVKHISISFKQSTCNACCMAKSHRLPTISSNSVTSKPFSLVHSDVWGPSPVTSLFGYRYYVSFIDDFTRYTWVYPLFHKSDVFAKFLEFNKMVNCQFKLHIKTFRTDGGGEFCNKRFDIFLKNLGIIHQYTCPHSPFQNGVAERKHRHLIETSRTLMIEASLPQTFWVDALMTSAYLINQLPSSTTSNKSPHELLFNKQPVYTHLKVFGSLCYPWLKPYSRNKLSPLSSPCVFIGYASVQKGYRCLDPTTNRIYTSCNVVFNEAVFPYQNRTSHTTAASNPTSHLPPLLLVPTSPLSSNFPCSTRLAVHPMLTRSKTGNSRPKHVFDLAHMIQPTDPTTFAQAIKDEHWRSAMSQEFQALQTQGTWDLVPPMPQQNVLGCKWMFRTKFRSDGSISRYKARLVAKGFNQEYGIDYQETFSPVAKIATIRIFILIALHFNWSITQLDISNAFLHGKLHDTVFMQQPPGFQDATHPNYVCKLNKALYGLKQSPREWYATLSTHLQQFGFQISSSDPSLLTYNKNNVRLYILIYVDDILLTGNSETELTRLLSNLHNKFQMKNLGKLSQFLGIQAVYTEYGILLQQQQYAKRILQRAGMDSSKPVLTPSSGKVVLTKNSNEAFANPQLYRHLIGSLQYLTLTRPDIQFAVHQLSQSMHLPCNYHFNSLKRLLRYIQGTTHVGIPLHKADLKLYGYADADWANDSTDRKSISGYCNMLGKSIISWQVKKQQTVARSSTEAEYRALAAEASEVLWLRRLLVDFHLPSTAPTTIFCDNTSAIALANNPVYHARTKHIDVDCHFIRDSIRAQHIIIHHICTKDAC
ncbi:Retrovirus-related Pol polyprotein from transposon TNT 1-94 [Dendrobium catenatum]|uniref:Retrovirus-related Pol polyprotein from transposon TNT 1-94 n=1 Tax=Dendrobium catenatum TaxID=906689 RepID=A0A2I0VA55_9ASPA|nr:Retrovirus-related Pol polyprotein from transposon TNT 1-94 [Dendrobium catenatum]